MSNKDSEYYREEEELITRWEKSGQPIFLITSALVFLKKTNIRYKNSHSYEGKMKKLL